jgi:seryl-tRNA synthetase
LKLAGVSHCFRREAGAAGSFRKASTGAPVHQGGDVRLYRPEESGAMHEYLWTWKRKFSSGLGIPFRVVDTCTATWAPRRTANGTWKLDARPQRRRVGRGDLHLQLYRLSGQAPHIKYKDETARTTRPYAHGTAGACYGR